MSVIPKSLQENKLARILILDEYFDLLLYKSLLGIARDDNMKKMLGDLVEIETKHFNFWQEFFGIKVNKLDLLRKTKLFIVTVICRLFGDKAINLILEAIEIYGIRKYLNIWEIYKGTPLADAVRETLDDEFRHEDRILGELVKRQIDPEKIRNIFLGFNDGLVEILGAVSGFFAAFKDATSVLIAGFTVAVAGAISMGAGVFVASGSEEEIKRVEAGKRSFYGILQDGIGHIDNPVVSALIVGVSYFFGAMVPVLPVLFGAKSIFMSLLCGLAMIVVISYVIAFLSGMNAKKRILTNLIIMAMAVGITYGIGTITKTIFGIAVS